MQQQTTKQHTTTRVQQRCDQAWVRDFNRATRTLGRCEATVKRLETMGVSMDAPAYRRAVLHRDLAWYAYEAVTD